MLLYTQTALVDTDNVKVFAAVNDYGKYIIKAVLGDNAKTNVVIFASRNKAEMIRAFDNISKCIIQQRSCLRLNKFGDDVDFVDYKEEDENETE